MSAWGAAANIFSAVLAFIALIVTVPLTLSYLSEERFGVWMTVASLAGMLTFLDMGVGNGFVSYIAKIKASNDFEEFRCAVTRGLLLLVVIGLIVGVILATANTLFPLQNIISVETAQAKDEARVCAWVFIFIFSFGIPISGVSRIFNGMQKSWVVHIVRAIGSVVSIFVVVLLSKNEAAPYYLLAGTYGIQTAMPLILLVYVLRKGWITKTPHRNWPRAKVEYKYLLDIGGLFFVLQIGTMVGWGADALIVSSLAGAVAVAQLAIAQRMYQLVSLPLSILNAPLWAAYADAKAHEDTGFLEQTLKKSLLGTLALSGILSISIFLVSGAILELWVGDAVKISTSLLLAFAIWKIMEATGNSFAMFLNGLHIMRPQVISVTIFCVLALPLKLYFVPQYGVPAVIWSTVVAYTIGVVVFYSFIYRQKIVEFIWNAV